MDEGVKEERGKASEDSRRLCVPYLVQGHIGPHVAIRRGIKGRKGKSGGHQNMRGGGIMKNTR